MSEKKVAAIAILHMKNLITKKIDGKVMKQVPNAIPY
jgi:hypothetical protein